MRSATATPRPQATETDALRHGGSVEGHGTGTWLTAGGVAAVGCIKSTDNGASWSAANGTNFNNARAWSAVGYGAGTWLVGSTDGTVQQSTNLGVTWFAVIALTGNPVMRSIAFSPESGGRWVAGVAGGEV